MKNRAFGFEEDRGVGHFVELWMVVVLLLVIIRLVLTAPFVGILKIGKKIRHTFKSRRINPEEYWSGTEHGP
ncbi:MAG: hypothetical protein M3Q73_03935 [bacterium]|nr:hypothetical protein [bacterium]